MTQVPQPRTSPEEVWPEESGDMPLSQMNYAWDLLDADQRAYVTLYYERIRKLNKQATEAWNKRANRLQFLKDYCAANNYTEHGTRDKIIKDWQFIDANDDWLRFSREIRRCQVAIDTELKMAIVLRGVRNAG